MIDRRADIWLSDIRTEITGIRALTRDETGETFAASWAMTRAVEHALMIIAGAAKQIPADMKATRPDVPWQKIQGLGNLLCHEYRRIEPQILWSVVTEHLAALDEAAESLLDDRCPG